LHIDLEFALAIGQLARPDADAIFFLA